MSTFHTIKAAKRTDRRALVVIDQEGKTFPVVFRGQTEADCIAWISRQSFARGPAEAAKVHRGAYVVKP